MLMRDGRGQRSKNIGGSKKKMEVSSHWISVSFFYPFPLLTRGPLSLNTQSF